MQQPFTAQGVLNSGHGGCRVGCIQGRGGRGGGRSRTPFAEAIRGTGASEPTMTKMVLYRGGIAQLPAALGVRLQCCNADYSNIHNIHNDWSVCFGCGFDVEDGYTSGTCPFTEWNHQDSYTHDNAQQFIPAGYDPCTKGMHKSVLPSISRNA